MTKKEKSIFAIFTIFIIALISATVAASFYSQKHPVKMLQTQPMSNIATLENNISIDEAKNIALSHSNQQSNPNIIFTSQKLDYDNGQEIYEIEFNDGVNEYDYDISANSGAIVNYCVENLDND